jgi:hypothetical protein
MKKLKIVPEYSDEELLLFLDQKIYSLEKILRELENEYKKHRIENAILKIRLLKNLERLMK